MFSEQVNLVSNESRMHFLRWEWPKTAINLTASGIEKDSTLTYADHPGFRCGTCFEYKMFDPINKNILNIIQKPLILMEQSLLNKNYLNFGYSKKSYELIDNLKFKCKLYKGNFSILWHNNNLVSNKARKMYLRCIDL